MSFPDLCRVGNGDRDDRTAGLGCHFHTSFFEWKHLAIFASGSFRENTDGDSLFDIVYASQDHLHTGTHVTAVQKQTVQPFHPVAEQRIFEHLCLCYIAGQIRTLRIGQQNIKIAAVVAYIENSLILWDIFMTNIIDLRTCYPQNKFENTLNHAKGADVSGTGIYFPDEPFDQQDRDTYDQVEQNDQHYQYKTYHKITPLFK